MAQQRLAENEPGIPRPPARTPQAAGCSFKYVEILKTLRKPDHSHPEVEILLVLSGGGTRIIGDTVGGFKEGDLFVLGSRLRHTFFPDHPGQGPVKTLVIQFRPEALAPAFAPFPEFRGLEDLLSRARLGLEALGNTRDTVAGMMRGIGAYPPMSPRRLGLLIGILAELAESGELATAAGPKILPLRGGRMDPKLDLLCRLIQNNLPQPLAQAAVASHLGKSPAAFSRWFRRHMGKSYRDYVNGARLEMAAKALADSDRPIARIRDEFGFAGESRFSRMFAALKGMPPSEYRRQARLGAGVAVVGGLLSGPLTGS